MSGGEYRPLLASFMHGTPQTAGIGATKLPVGGMTLLNAPAAMQGNGTYTVAVVVRPDATVTGGGLPIWATGDYTSTNTQVGLFSTTGGLAAFWSNYNNGWSFSSGFVPTAGSWYFVVATIQANGDTPIGHLWVGVGGKLLDKFSGAVRGTFGTATKTPAVAATPMWLGSDGQNHQFAASYAGLFVYSRALGQAEVGLMYTTLKAKMAARGVTLQ